MKPVVSPCSCKRCYNEAHVWAKRLTVGSLSPFGGSKYILVFLTCPCLHNVVQNHQRYPIVINSLKRSLLQSHGCKLPSTYPPILAEVLELVCRPDRLSSGLDHGFGKKKQIQPGLGTDCSGPVCHSHGVQTKLYSAVTGANIRSDGCFYEKTGHVQWFLQRDTLLQNCVFMKSSLGRLIDLCCIQHETDKIC